MKNIDVYKSKLNISNHNQVFNYLMNSFKDTIKGWDYFVDWAKVLTNVGNIEMSLNLMNYLIGKENIEEEFKNLLRNYPQIITVIPVLIACRDEDVTVLNPTHENIFNFKLYSFKGKRISEKDVDDATEFVSKTKVLELFGNKKIKSIIDYVIGIEVGLDSNARKNRSGTSMEFITELFIKKICVQLGYRYIKQATAEKIRNEFGYTVNVDKNNRRFDFAVANKTKLYLIETNFYGGGGSKLKATAGEYKSLYDFIKNGNDKHGFIWITDGKGWTTARNPLEETFNHIDYVLNLDMLEKGILHEIIEKSL